MNVHEVRLTDSQSKSVVPFAGAGVVSFAVAVARLPWQTAVNKLWLTSRNPATVGIPEVTATATARSKVRVVRLGRWFDFEDRGGVDTDACSTLRSVPYILGFGGGRALLWWVVLLVSVCKISPSVNLQECVVERATEKANGDCKRNRPRISTVSEQHAHCQCYRAIRLYRLRCKSLLTHLLSYPRGLRKLEG